MAQAYDFLAEWFEILNDDCDYAAWSQYFIAGLSRLRAGKCGLELGCGSGAFCRALAKAGYRMTGADLSLPMLNKARQLSCGTSVEYVRADAAALKTPVRYDFILSPNDCFNYIPPEKLKGAFGHIEKCLKPRGIFWFDVSSETHLRQKVGNNLSGDDRDDLTYLAFNTLEGDSVRTDVTLFVREGELFRRYDETHIRYIHTQERLVRALAEAGFEILSAEGHLGEAAEGSDRLNLICRRK